MIGKNQYGNPIKIESELLWALYWGNEFSLRKIADIFKRDNYICQSCEKRGGNLHAHHILGFANIIEIYNIKYKDDALKCGRLWDISNGITYCTKCHKEFHKIDRKFKGIITTELVI